MSYLATTIENRGEAEWMKLIANFPNRKDIMDLP